MSCTLSFCTAFAEVKQVQQKKWMKHNVHFDCKDTAFFAYMQILGRKNRKYTGKKSIFSSKYAMLSGFRMQSHSFIHKHVRAGARTRQNNTKNPYSQSVNTWHFWCIMHAESAFFVQNRTFLAFFRRKICIFQKFFVPLHRSNLKIEWQTIELPPS